MNKWHIRFLELAKHIAQWSKDPSTKVGAVITKDNRIISVGYNGFPKRVKDSKERYADRKIKYPMVVHAEANAILFSKESLEGCQLYTWPLFTCCDCAGLVVQSGIRSVFYPEGGDNNERWQSQYDLTKQMYEEANVRHFAIDMRVSTDELTTDKFPNITGYY